MALGICLSCPSPADITELLILGQISEKETRYLSIMVTHICQWIKNVIKLQILNHILSFQRLIQQIIWYDIGRPSAPQASKWTHSGGDLQCTWTCITLISDCTMLTLLMWNLNVPLLLYLRVCGNMSASTSLVNVLMWVTCCCCIEWNNKADMWLLYNCQGYLRLGRSWLKTIFKIQSAISAFPSPQPCVLYKCIHQ